MKKIEMFQCEGCGSNHKTATKALKCEKQHENVVAAFKQAIQKKEIFKCKIVSAYRHLGQYRTTVFFELLDGTLKGTTVMAYVDTDA